MSLLIKNWSKVDWEELLEWAKIGANNAMIGEFTEVVELPPHGRLIDADALDTSILQAGFAYAITRRKLRYTPGEVRDKIQNAPTIIPASEEE